MSSEATAVSPRTLEKFDLNGSTPNDANVPLLTLPRCSPLTLPISAGPEHSHASCNVSDKTGQKYPSLEMSVSSVILLLDSVHGFILVAIMLIPAPSEDDVANEIPFVTHGAADSHDENFLHQNEDLHDTADPSSIPTATLVPDGRNILLPQSAKLWHPDNFAIMVLLSQIPPTLVQSIEKEDDIPALIHIMVIFITLAICYFIATRKIEDYVTEPESDETQNLN